MHHEQLIYSGVDATISTSSTLLVEGFHFCEGDPTTNMREFGKCWTGTHTIARKKEECVISSVPMRQLRS